jgi:hypothetical protein
MASSRAKRSRTEPQVEQKEIKVGQKYECRFNNDPDEKMVSCITKEKKPDGTWLVQYSGISTQVIVDECNISAKNGNVFVPCESPEKQARKAKRNQNKADAVKAVVFKDIPVVVAIENTTLVAPTQEKSTCQGANVIAVVESDNPIDIMTEIKRQGKFQLCNKDRFKELAVMKLKEPVEAWSSFDLAAWFEEMQHEVANIAPDETLRDWISKQANTVHTMFLKKIERIKEDEPALQGNENEKGKENNLIEVSQQNVEEEDNFIPKASPNEAASPKKPVALRKLNTRIKTEGDVTSEKFDELPSVKAYVVVSTIALYAGPETEDKEANAFNRNVLRSRVYRAR